MLQIHCPDRPGTGYLVERVYVDSWRSRGIDSAFRVRKRIVALDDNGARSVVFELGPTISAKGVSQLTSDEMRFATSFWGHLQFLELPWQLRDVRDTIDDHVLAHDEQLDKRKDRTAKRLPFTETGGPWQQVSTQYPWQNSVGLYLPKDLLNSDSFEKHMYHLGKNVFFVTRP